MICLNIICLKRNFYKKTIVFILIAVLIFAVSATFEHDFGYKLYIEGIYAGSFLSESDAEKVVNVIKEKDGLDLAEKTETVFALMDNKCFTDVETACDNFRKQDERFIPGYTFIAEGNEIFTVESMELMNAVKEEFFAPYREKGVTEIDFSSDNNIKEQYVLKSRVSDFDTAKALLRPFSEVKTVVKLSYYEPVPYITLEVEDEELYEGETVFAFSGKSGEKYVEHTEIKLNGETISSNITGEFIAENVQNRIVKTGTKPFPSGVAMGSFSNPTEGYISSGFGPRWGRYHSGLDIAASFDTPIYASDGGKVIYSGAMGGYGNLVQIDHKNGYITYYGHCSKLHVKTGDEVKKGEHIADVGSTGNSTGPHLHFEIRLDNVCRNPQEYVNY